MGYERIGAYWLCNDFERFWTHIDKGLKVYYLSDKTHGRIETGSKRTLGGNKYRVKLLFRKQNFKFIDPSCVVNPELKDIVDAAPPQLRWNLDLAPVLHDMKEMFNTLASERHRKVEAIARILDNWVFDTGEEKEKWTQG